MTLMTYTLHKLIELNEITTATELSVTWCNKNPNWYAWQKHAENDFSVDAAINCLAHLRVRLTQVRAQRIKREMAHLENMLSDYLLHKHKIAAIAEPEQAQEQML